MAIKKFVHIGMPKTITSAFQVAFFNCHKDIYYLGVGVGSLIDYVDDDINILFETLIPYSSQSFYELKKNSFKDKLNRQLEYAESEKNSWVGVSSEWLGFNFTPEMVDPELKTKRLAELMGMDCKIILIIRNQWSLLKSLYAELVKTGYSGGYLEYCSYLWNFRDRSSLPDFLYDVQYKRLCQYFQESNINILPLENYRNESGELSESNGIIHIIDEMCRILGVDYPENLIIPHVNLSLDKAEVVQKLKLNKKYRHDFGNLIFEPSNIHRSRKQLERNGQIGISDFFHDVKIKRMLIELAKEQAKLSDEEQDFNLPKMLGENLDNIFRSSNKTFQILSGINLPSEYFYKRDYK